MAERGIDHSLDSLTEAERDVPALMARGPSDRGLAEQPYRQCPHVDFPQTGVVSR